MKLRTILISAREHKASDAHILVGLPPMFRIGGEIVAANAPPEIQRNLEIVNTDRLEEGLFRMCINYDERDRAWCVFVNVKAEPPTVVRDPSEVPNQPR